MLGVEAAVAIKLPDSSVSDSIVNVPLFVSSPVTVNAPSLLIVIAPPEYMYSLGIEYVFPAELPEPISNVLFEPLSCRIHTLSSAVGTFPLPQLEPTDQSPLVPPFHVSTSFDPIQLPGSKS